MYKQFWYFDEIILCLYPLRNIKKGKKTFYRHIFYYYFTSSTYIHCNCLGESIPIIDHFANITKTLLYTHWHCSIYESNNKKDHMDQKKNSNTINKRQIKLENKIVSHPNVLTKEKFYDNGSYGVTVYLFFYQDFYTSVHMGWVEYLNFLILEFLYFCS